MRELLTWDLGDGHRGVVAHSTRLDGDLSPTTVAVDELAQRRHRCVAAGPWHSLHQVHGNRVIDVDRDPATTPPDFATSLFGPRAKADALVSALPGQVLAVHSGDCVPVGLIHHAGAVAVAHAGWKGLESGVLQAVVDRIRAVHGPGEIRAAVGPHIRVSAYEFGSDDLARLAKRFGDRVVGTTTTGAPALDLTAAATGELARLDVDVAAISPDCTATIADRYWSHRARGESGRIALVAWLASP